MAHPTQLNATEQDTLVKQIGLALLRTAPRDWQRIAADYRAVGRYHELDGEITLADGSTREWVATHDIATLFGRLRAGMYRDERGTWFNARYQLDAPSSYNLEYDREEPRWQLMPPPQAYADELRVFPRSEDNIPEWLMRRMAGLAPERPGPRFRIARVFDGTGPSGRPLINRPELDVEDQDKLLEYLNSAPVVLPGRGLDIDRLAATPEPGVPVAFHSDGTWIWPAAVNYYLDQYGVSPEPDLVEHIRHNSFQVPEVTEDKRAAANAYLTRGNTPPSMPVPTMPPPMPRSFRPPQASPAPQAPPAPPAPLVAPPPAPMPPPAPPEPAAVESHEQPAPGRHSVEEEPADTALPLPDTMFAPLPDFDDDDYDEPTASGIDAGPSSDRSSQIASGLEDEPAVKRLHSKLDELGIDEERYTVGSPNRHGWSLEQVPEGWRVGWYDETLSNPALFGDAEDAAAFMLGKLLLVPEGTSTVGRPEIGEQSPGQAGEQSPAPAGEQSGQAGEQPAPRLAPIEGIDPPLLTHATEPESSSAMGLTDLPQRPQSPPPPPPRAFRPTAATPHNPAVGAPSQPQAGQPWPIQPLPGEPPLTLFRGKELQELPAGSELDRFGTPEGNLTYAAGTPFTERSLVPEWVNRPYHVYRVQRPIEALAGVAIPWFNQPGGGAAYLLPASVEELLADGVLIELDPGEPPTD